MARRPTPKELREQNPHLPETVYRGYERLHEPVIKAAEDVKESGQNFINDGGWGGWGS